MRIVAGSARGRTLKTPRGSDVTRPTADRVRETIFNVLGQTCEGLRVLDLFAGTGALAIEALSRGAAYAVLVDEGIEARGLQRGHVEALGLGGICRILRRDATKLGPVTPFEPFTLVFCDPPYGKELGERALRSALDGGWLAPGAIVILEERAGLEIVLPEPLVWLDQRMAGEGQILIGMLPAG